MTEKTGEEVHEVYRKEGVRLEEDMVDELYDYFYSPPAVLEILEGIHAFDKAHTVMLVEEGIISKADGVQILNGLREMEERGVIATREQLGGHFHTGEAFLTEQLDESVAGRIHAGRSSGDLQAVGSRWRNREGIIGVMERLNELRESMLETADEHTETVMPGYTHMRHAQPTTFGHYLLSFEKAFERDYERLQQAYAHTNVSPAGAAIMTGSSFPLNRDRTRELLGFDDLYSNTMDAVFNTDFGLETHAALMSLQSTITKLAEDLILFETDEYNFLSLADRFSGTSSIMPQKKNPYLNEFIITTTGDVYGNGLSAFVSNNESHGRMETLISGFKNLWETFDLLNVVLDLLADAIRTVNVNEDVMREAAGSHWAQATDIADLMVQERDIPFRSAHQITGVLVRHCTSNGVEPKDVTVDMVDRAAEEVLGEKIALDEETLERALDPEKCVNARTLVGGPAFANVEAEVGNSRKQLGQDRAEVEERRSKLDDAAAELEAAIDSLVEA